MIPALAQKGILSSLLGGMVFLLVSVPVLAVSFEDIADTPPDSRIRDFGHMLDEEHDAIRSHIQTIEQETSAEIAVVTLDALPLDHTIETFAVELFESWGIGKKENDNGLLLLISRDDKKFRLEVGYGLEGVLPDSVARSILQTHLVPAFQKQQYGEGVLASLASIHQRLEGNLSEVFVETKHKQDIPNWFVFVCLLWIVITGVVQKKFFQEKTEFSWGMFLIGGICAYLLVQVLGSILYVFLWIITRLSGKGSGRTGNTFGGGGLSSGGGFGGGMSGGGGFSGSW